MQKSIESKLCIIQNPTKMPKAVTMAARTVPGSACFCPSRCLCLIRCPLRQDCRRTRSCADKQKNKAGHLISFIYRKCTVCVDGVAPTRLRCERQCFWIISAALFFFFAPKSDGNDGSVNNEELSRTCETDCDNIIFDDFFVCLRTFLNKHYLNWILYYFEVSLLL